LVRLYIILNYNMSTSSSDLMKLESLDNQFILLLEQYQQITNTYFSLNNTQANEVIALQGKGFIGQFTDFYSSPSIELCQASCSTGAGCSGVSYNTDDDLCVSYTGDLSIYNTNNNSNYAIFSSKQQLLTELQNINQSLYNILNSSSILVKQVNPDSEAQTRQLRIETDKLRVKYDLFLRNKLELDNLIKENTDLDNEYNISSIMVKQSNLSYFFWSIGAIVLIIITIGFFLQK